MPIKPENRAKYPANWKAIREHIRGRASNRCERCSVSNHAIGYRDWTGAFYHQDGTPGTEFLHNAFGIRKIFKIVCTVAHLNHNPADNRRKNLAFLCQQCHNRHDVQHRAETRRASRTTATA